MCWKNMNADLSKLCEFIQKFFREREFNVSVDKSENCFKIFVKPRKFHEILGNIVVTVEGKPNDFCVRVEASNLSRSFIFLGSLFSFLGLGFLAVKGHKSEENLEKLMKELKVFVAEKVWKASNVVA